MATLSISKKDISQLKPADIKALAQRLDSDDYTNPFEGLDDWHLLRAIAFQRPELVEPYLYLLEFEDCDEA